MKNLTLDKNLTTDQVELTFSLFIAQNADRKISEFVEIGETRFWEEWSNEIKQDLLTKCISDLKIVRFVPMISLLLINQTEELELRVFEYCDEFQLFNFTDSWRFEAFDIMKYISLEDKV